MKQVRSSVRTLNIAIAEQEQRWVRELRSMPEPSRTSATSRLLATARTSIDLAESAWEDGRFSKAIQLMYTARRLVGIAEEVS